MADLIRDVSSLLHSLPAREWTALFSGRQYSIETGEERVVLYMVIGPTALGLAIP